MALKLYTFEWATLRWSTGLRNTRFFSRISVHQSRSAKSAIIAPPNLAVWLPISLLLVPLRLKWLKCKWQIVCMQSRFLFDVLVKKFLSSRQSDFSSSLHVDRTMITKSIVKLSSCQGWLSFSIKSNQWTMIPWINLRVICILDLT